MYSDHEIIEDYRERTTGNHEPNYYEPEINENIEQEELIYRTIMRNDDGELD